MQEWSTLTATPMIDQEGDPESPEASDIGVRAPQISGKSDLYDEKVHALLEALETDEGIPLVDVSVEERQAIANFDIRAYT